MRDAGKALRESERRAEEHRKKCAPFNKITLAVVRATEQCTNRIAPFIKGPNPEQRKALVEAQFLFFFLQLCDRKAFSTLQPEQVGKLHAIISPEVFGATVDAHFLHAPAEMKKEIRSALYKGLKEAAIDYDSSTEWLSKNEPYTGNSLLSKLLRRVMKEIGGEADAKLMIEVIKAATDALDNSGLPVLIEAIKPLIDDFEIFEYEPWDDPGYERRLRGLR